jgi:hypothetical protein
MEIKKLAANWKLDPNEYIDFGVDDIYKAMAAEIMAEIDAAIIKKLSNYLTGISKRSERMSIIYSMIFKELKDGKNSEKIRIEFFSNHMKEVGLRFYSPSYVLTMHRDTDSFYRGGYAKRMWPQATSAITFDEPSDHTVFSFEEVNNLISVAEDIIGDSIENISFNTLSYIATTDSNKDRTGE